MTDAIIVNGVRKAYGSVTVLDGLSFTVQLGETVVLIGKSGSGKSTMLRCLNLLEQWNEGEILVWGKPLGFDKTADGREVRWNGRRQAEARCKIGMVFQQFNLFPHLTALQNVMVGPRKILGIARDEANTIAANLLAQVGLAEKGDAYPAHLSGGQQQRVAIARALAMKPDILLLDEITSALDPQLVGEVLDVVADLKRQGLTMVFVTHEIQFAHDVADKVLFLESGRVLEAGPPANVLDSPKTDQLRRFLARFTASRPTTPVE